jgi:hypothetical protein
MTLLVWVLWLILTLKALARGYYKPLCNPKENRLVLEIYGFVGFYITFLGGLLLILYVQGLTINISTLGIALLSVKLIIPSSRGD